ADTQCCGVSAASVADRAGWAEVPAVRNGHIYELDADVASRWGPRTVDMVARIAAAVSEAQASHVPR
nr:ABC transporter substrate-binding protein [Streptomyces sp. DSM 41633]